MLIIYQAFTSCSSSAGSSRFWSPCKVTVAPCGWTWSEPAAAPGPRVGAWRLLAPSRCRCCLRGKKSDGIQKKRGRKWDGQGGREDGKDRGAGMKKWDRIRWREWAMVSWKKGGKEGRRERHWERVSTVSGRRVKRDSNGYKNGHKGSHVLCDWLIWKLMKKNNVTFNEIDVYLKVKGSL